MVKIEIHVLQVTVTPVLLWFLPFIVTALIVAMQKLGEVWSENGVTSTFKVLFHCGHPLCCAQGSCVTSVCGFGWRFGISGRLIKTAAKKSQIFNSEIQITFDPHLLTNAQLGTLAISTERRTITKWEDTQLVGNNLPKLSSRFINVPLSGPSEITSHFISFNKDDGVVLVIRVQFPVTLGSPNLFPNHP